MVELFYIKYELMNSYYLFDVYPWTHVNLIFLNHDDIMWVFVDERGVLWTNARSTE